MPDSPNILFVHTDEQRADTLGCYGNDVVDTPHIDGLADEGATFENAHCTHPLCMPSRASLLTGRYPSVNGVWRNGIPLPDDEQTVAELLREEGYTTGLLGKAHFVPYHGDPELHPESVQTGVVDDEECWEFWRDFDGPYYGFDHVEMAIAHSDNGIQGGHYGLWLAEEHPEKRELFSQDAALDDTDSAYNSWKSAVPLDIHSSTWVADRTIEFVDDHADDQPFFAWVGFPDPHFPYDPPEPYCYEYDPEDVSLPVDSEGDVWGDDPPRHVEYHLDEKYGVDWREMSEKKQREVIAHYYAMTDLVDDQVGRILTALEEYGIAENTVVVFTSDHGDWLGDHGLFQKGLPHTRGLTRIPWIIRWPDMVQDGHRIESVASQLDLVPTLLDAAGVEVPYGIQGDSLRPVLGGERDSLRPYALVEHRHEAYRENSFLVQHGAGGVRKDEIQDDIVNWGDEAIHAKTIYTDRYRLSYVTGVEEGGNNGVTKSYGRLFDHETDPEEIEDLWDENPELRHRLLALLAEALMKADDPLPERKWPV